MQAYKIDKIEPSIYIGEVCNIEVEEDNSYVTESFVVHNCDPTRTGDKFFDITKVKAMLERATPPTKVSGLIRYWDVYNPSHRYGMGGDLSDGIGKDSCALGLFDFKQGKLVASADDNLTPPDLFTYEGVRLGGEFGNCIFAPETNNTCGGIAIRVLKEEQYPNIYQKEITDKVNNVISTTLGWHSNRKTKPDMFYEFKKDFNDGLIEIPDERVLKEMLAFTKLDLQDARSSAITRHFDLLTSCFVEGTMILTDNGQRNIEELNVGDLVMTRDGYKPIIATMCSLKRVVTNIGLTGTPDHPVFCNDNEIKDLSHIDKDDRMYIWDSKVQKIERQFYTEVQNTIDIQTQNYEHIGNTYQRVFNIQVADSPEYFANNILVHNCVIAYQMKDHAGGNEGVRDFYANMQGKRKTAQR